MKKWKCILLPWFKFKQFTFNSIIGRKKHFIVWSFISLLFSLFLCVLFVRWTFGLVMLFSRDAKINKISNIQPNLENKHKNFQFKWRIQFHLFMNIERHSFCLFDIAIGKLTLTLNWILNTFLWTPNRNLCEHHTSTHQIHRTVRKRTVKERWKNNNKST